jgi:hypothetical protein
MPATYSINVGQTTEAYRKQDINSVLADIPNNTQKLISPKDVRDAFLSSWANSSFKQTVGVASIEHIGLDSGMVMFIDSEMPTFCIIYHKDELQNKFLTGPVKMNNTIHDFINGNITYKIPKNITGKIFTVNKKRYDEMDIKLSIELIKGFSYPS